VLDDDILKIKGIQTISKIKEFDSKINQNLKGMKKEMDILMSIPGVGFTTAAAILAEIGNIEEFSEPKKLVGWSGLAPAINESAGKSSNGHITKKGHKKAIVALARKLATIIHHLLTFKEVYSEEEGKEKKFKIPKFVPVPDFSIDDMIGILCEAGYSVNKPAANT
jgi:transposase